MSDDVNRKEFVERTLRTDLLTSETARDIGGRIVSSLFDLDVTPGSTIVFQSPNSVTLLAGIYGALLAGLAPVIIGEKLNERETGEIVSNFSSAIVVTESMLEKGARTSFDLSITSSHRFKCRPIHFTSGTSGRAKGVWSGWMSDADADAQSDDERSAWSFSPTDVHLVCGPLSHSAPLRFALHTLLNGGGVIVPLQPDATKLSALIEHGGVTTTFMAPILLQRIVDSAPPKSHTLRFLAHAGAPCPEPVRVRAIDCFGGGPLIEFYGSTEGQFTLCPVSEWLEHRGTVGRARPGRELRVVDGRVWCRAPVFARFEYWEDPDATEAAWEGEWFTVGDLGRLDDEGRLFLEGRRTDLIISGGVNVYPAEIERVLSMAPGVSEVAVFGVDDPVWGQRVCALFAGSTDDESLAAYCRDNMAPVKRPKTFVKVSALPLTHNGKIDRSALATFLSRTDG